MDATRFDYDAAIAEAARRWVQARRDADLRRDAARAEAASLAHEKLCWMVDAERHGWDPATYISETEL